MLFYTKFENNSFANEHGVITLVTLTLSDKYIVLKQDKVYRKYF